MTDLLSEVRDRIEGVRQLGAVVGAMTGIAASRARAARGQTRAVESYARAIAAAMGRVIVALPPSEAPDVPPTLVVFCAEQGFVGAFSERVLDCIDPKDANSDIFLVGTRGATIADGRGLLPVWRGAMPSRSASIPKFADRLVQAILAHNNAGEIGVLDVMFTIWQQGHATVERHRLFPIDTSTLPHADLPPPLTNLPQSALLAALGADYLHALLCHAALHAFAAENEARMEAMSSAGSQIAHELEAFQAKLRRVRQEAITAEIIELGTGAAAAEAAR